MVQAQESGAEVVCRLSGTTMKHYTEVCDMLDELCRQEEKVRCTAVLDLDSCSHVHIKQPFAQAHELHPCIFAFWPGVTQLHCG